MGGRNLSLKKLITQREKVIRVKLLQKRRTKVQILRQKQNERMEKLGPKVLGKKSSKIPAVLFSHACVFSILASFFSNNNPAWHNNDP
jgi:hypothetical protein